MPPLPAGARSRMTAAPASPRVSDATSRLRMLRTCAAALTPSREMYSPLTTMPQRISPLRIRLATTNTPVSIPAQALERSNGTALVAPIASATATLIGGSIHWTRSSRYLVMLQDTTASRSSGPWRDRARQSAAAPTARVREVSRPSDTRRSRIPVSRSRSILVRCRVDAISFPVVRRVAGRRRPTLYSRATCGARDPFGVPSSISHVLDIASHPQFVSGLTDLHRGRPGLAQTEPDDPFEPGLMPREPRRCQVADSRERAWGAGDAGRAGAGGRAGGSAGESGRARAAEGARPRGPAGGDRRRAGDARRAPAGAHHPRPPSPAVPVVAAVRRHAAAAQRAAARGRGAGGAPHRLQLSLVVRVGAARPPRGPGRPGTGGDRGGSDLGRSRPLDGAPVPAPARHRRAARTTDDHGLDLGDARRAARGPRADRALHARRPLRDARNDPEQPGRRGRTERAGR